MSYLSERDASRYRDGQKGLWGVVGCSSDLLKVGILGQSRNDRIWWGSR